EKARSLDSAITTGLLNSADKTVHLSQRLLLARLEELHQTLEPCFVLANGAKCLAHFRGYLLQNNLRCLPGRPQLERVCTRVRHDQINMLLQWNNLALFFEAGRSGRGRPRQESLTRRNGKNRWCGSEFLKGGILKMTSNHRNLGGIAQVGLLQHGNDFFQPTVLHKTKTIFFSQRFCTKARRSQADCVQGLTTENTKNTRSARGTNSSVMR